MSSHTNLSATSPDDGSHSGSVAERFAALAEVLIAFVVVHLSYRSFKHFTRIGRAEGASTLNFSAGAMMILFVTLVLLVCKRQFRAYGLTLKDWRYNLNIGLLWGPLTVGTGGLIARFAHIQFDPLTPPDMKRALAASACLLAATLLLIRFLMRDRLWMRRIPAFVSFLVLALVLSVPLAVAWHHPRPLLKVLLTVAWLFIGAGFGEEIFFRGYIQSRVNQAFGRPFHFMGIDFGLGLLVSSLLFGFIHALNTVDYFSGRWTFAWWSGVFTFVAGLFYGCLREKTGSVLAGSVLHGLFDVLGRIPSLI